MSIEACIYNPSVQTTLANWPYQVYNICGAITADLDTIRASSLTLEAASGGAARDLVMVMSLDDLVIGDRMYRATAPGFRAANFYGDAVATATSHVWGASTPPLLPGVTELVQRVVELDMSVIILTGRREGRRAETVASLVYAGLAGAGAGAIFAEAELQDPQGALQMRPDDDDRPSEYGFKFERCQMVEKNYRIALNVGTQLSAMVAGDRQLLCPHQLYIVA